MEQDLVTAAEAAILLDLPTATVRRMVDAGDIPGTWETHSGECCIPRDAVLRFKKQLSAEQMQGLNNMSDDVNEMGLYERPDSKEPQSKRER